MKLRLFVCIVLTCYFMVGCKKSFLETTPQATLTEAAVSTPKTVDGLVIAAYAWLPHEATLGQKLSPWLADIKSDDSYKGGGGLSDQAPWYQWEIFTAVTPAVGNNDGMWYGSYQGISRCNLALRALNNLTVDEYPLKEQRIAEMRFIRGVLYSQVKEWYKWIPYFDENVPLDSIPSITNRDDSQPNDLYIWQSILNDFTAAANVLPESQTELARPTKYAAMAFEAKCLMWMAYEQDKNNSVININKNTLTSAMSVIDAIINSGKYSLTPDFGDNFLASNDNKLPENIWEWQYSHSDGTPNGNLNGGTPLNAPWWPPHFNCCDFHKPSYTMVNAFRVSPNGLPMFENYNADEIDNKDSYLKRNNWDPRFGHTVAVPGLPWKYQSDLIFDSAGSRVPANYAYFNSLKENVQSTSSALVDLFWMWNSKNVCPIRFDQILLWKAECLIELDRHAEALPIINQIRARAGNSTSKLVFANGTPTLNYNIQLYQDGINCNWTPEFALEALRWEDRLEFAMEGTRWFDIVRWGIAKEVLDSYFAAEVSRQGPDTWIFDGKFTAGRDEFMPIPQPQINLAGPVYKQNAGY